MIAQKLKKSNDITGHELWKLVKFANWAILKYDQICVVCCDSAANAIILHFSQQQQ